MNFSKETIDKITAELIDKEINGQASTIKKSVKAHLAQYLKTKAFKKFITKQIEQAVEENVSSDGPLVYLNDTETDALMKKAVKAILR